MNVPADVPRSKISEYKKNYNAVTKGTGRLMMFAGDQRIEHLNDDFYGQTKLGMIPTEDNDPEHLFRIASRATIGCFATQYGQLVHYGRDYKDVDYLVKLNSKTNLVKTSQKEPLSKSLVSMEDVLLLKKNSGLKIRGVGYTIYLGSEYEAEMLAEAGRIVAEAHRNGLLVVLWIYPRGKAVKNEKDAHLIAGATGVAGCLGADFVKVNYPEAANPAKAFREAVISAGRTGVIVSGGSSTSAKAFLKKTYEEIHVSGARGSATGRNVHQKPLGEAIRMCNAIAAIVFEGRSVEYAVDLHDGKV